MLVMPRHAPALECSAEDAASLTAISKSRTEEARTVERARIVLACLEGKENQQVAQGLGVSVPTVGKLASAGFEALFDTAGFAASLFGNGSVMAGLRGDASGGGGRAAPRSAWPAAGRSGCRPAGARERRAARADPRLCRAARVSTRSAGTPGNSGARCT